VLGIGEFTEWMHFSIIIIIQGLLLYGYRRKHKDHAILMELTTAYLINGGKEYIDILLGKLISGNWKRNEIVPGDALFNVLEEYTRGSEYEIKRRISEALPALCTINSKKTLTLLKNLREDYDAEKWKDDNRRRAIESLGITFSYSRLPILEKYSKEIIAEILTLRDDDQIFTAFAISDVLFEWMKMSRGKALDYIEEVDKKITMSAHSLYSNDEYSAFRENQSIKYSSLNEGVDEVFRSLKLLFKNENLYVRIAAARNILICCEDRRQATLSLILEVLNAETHRYVKRPLAKEMVMIFVVKSLDLPNFQMIAKEIIVKLLSESDDIVRITAFDMIESIAMNNKHMPFLNEICGDVIMNENRPEIIAKAKILRSL
jgi:hypothetical protein